MYFLTKFAFLEGRRADGLDDVVGFGLFAREDQVLDEPGRDEACGDDAPADGGEGGGRHFGWFSLGEGGREIEVRG